MVLTDKLTQTLQIKNVLET